MIRIKIPKSKIKTGLFASNGEYVNKKTKLPYNGPYYKINGKLFIGKDFDPNVDPIEIELKSQVKYSATAFLYDVLAGVKQGSVTSVSSSPVKTKSSILTPSQLLATQQGMTDEIGLNNKADIDALNTASESQLANTTPTTQKRYFYRVMISLKPLEYKFGEVKTEEEFNTLSERPNYETASVTETTVPGQAPVLDERELEAAEKKIPGLKAFLENQPKNTSETVAQPTQTTTVDTTSTTTSTSGGGGGGGGAVSSGGMLTSGAGSNVFSRPSNFR